MQLVQAIAAQRNSPSSCDIYYESGIIAAGTITIDASKPKQRRKKADPNSVIRSRTITKAALVANMLRFGTR